MSKDKLIGKKTLQEIQELPLSVMHKHMREYVDPKWQRWAKADGKLAVYNVKVELTTTNNKSFNIEAHSIEEANELAEGYVDENYEFDDYYIWHLKEEQL